MIDYCSLMDKIISHIWKNNIKDNRFKIEMNKSYTMPFNVLNYDILYNNAIYTIIFKETPKDTFIDFLKRNKIYDKFNACISNKPYNKTIDDIYNNEYYLDYIYNYITSLDNNSPQFLSHWYNIHRKWAKLISKRYDAIQKIMENADKNGNRYEKRRT